MNDYISKAKEQSRYLAALANKNSREAGNALWHWLTNSPRAAFAARFSLNALAAGCVTGFTLITTWLFSLLYRVMCKFIELAMVAVSTLVLGIARKVAEQSSSDLVAVNRRFDQADENAARFASIIFAMLTRKTVKTALTVLVAAFAIITSTQYYFKGVAGINISEILADNGNSMLSLMMTGKGATALFVSSALVVVGVIMLGCLIHASVKCNRSRKNDETSQDYSTMFVDEFHRSMRAMDLNAAKVAERFRSAIRPRQESVS